MGEFGATSVAVVLQAAAAQLQERAISLLQLAASNCVAEPRVMGALQVAAGLLLRSAGECTLQVLHEPPSESEAHAWNLARLERLAEVVGQADDALVRAAAPAAEAAARLANVGLPHALERGITRRILRALEVLRSAGPARADVQGGT